MHVIALAGNPNCGKTTLFNRTTGEKAAVGNWPGVTVQKREGFLSLAVGKTKVIDLPGTYSLTPCCPEEAVTLSYLKRNEASLLINVVNPAFLRRELFLTLELLALKTPLICAVNMADEMEKNNILLDFDRLSEALGVRVVPISAKTGEGISELTEAANEILEGNAVLSKKAKPAPSHEAVAEILRFCGYLAPENSVFAFTRKADRLLLGKYTAFPFLFLVMACMFFFAFGAPGRFFTVLVDSVFSLFLSAAQPVFASLPAWTDSLLREGVFTGAFSVLSFLPQVAILYFFTVFIEESGYMARAAFLTDRLFRKIGLSGRSVIPMIMGLGCTTTAVAASRGIDSERDRKMTVMLTPFVSCGAKLPVYALIASECFGALAPAAIMGVYLTGFTVLAASGALLNRVLHKNAPSVFILELPPYRLPKPETILKRSLLRISEFARRVGTVILLTCALSWFLTYFTPSLTPAETADASLLACAAKTVSPLFRPLGFGSWQAVSALLSGVFAKESILSSLRIFAPGALDSLFTPSGAYAYLIFILLSPPCVSALISIRRELESRRLTFFTILMQFSVAYASAMLVFRIL